MLEGKLNFIQEIFSKSFEHASKLQSNHSELFEKIAKKFKQWLIEDNLVIKIKYNPKDYWNSVKDKTFCAIDAGVADPNIPTSDPYAILCCSYIVKPSENNLKKREKINNSFMLIQDLYDQKDNIYDFLKCEEDIDNLTLNLEKKRAARISCELTTAVIERNKSDFMFVHGPIQPIVGAFSADYFPSFTHKAWKEFRPEDKDKNPDLNKRHFIQVTKENLEELKKSPIPVYGCVERSRSRLYIYNIAKKKLANNELKNFINTCKNYRLHDAILFDYILEKDECIKPIEVVKQRSDAERIITDQSEKWCQVIDAYPKVYIGYVKARENFPFRIETLAKPTNIEDDLNNILHHSRLTPSYGFPEIINIVDKHARIPSKLRKIMTGIHSKNYMKKAIETGDKKKIRNAIKIFNNNYKHSFYNRPK